ncbi:MAG: carboxypeptidase M32 [Rubrobacteraceae bacterium]
MDTKDSNTALELLKERFATISDLRAAAALLSWDQETHMPKASVPLRSEQLATLSKLSHEMLVSEEMGGLISSVNGTPSAGNAALLRVAKRDYDRATKLPSKLVAEISRATSLAQPAWQKAREESDWEMFAPHLERIVGLQRKTAKHLGYEDHPYDALLDLYEPGARKAKLEGMFEELKNGIVPLLRTITASGAEDRSGPLNGDFDEAKQEEFGRSVLADVGYDWERGRQDRVVHAFCISIGGPEDVRVTTNFSPTKIDHALFTSMHEGGHAMYEQGVDPKYSRTPLAGGTSMGVHESQSKLWENLVGRSRGFWNHYYPKLQKTFPDALGDVDLETFYRAINEVRPGFIRIYADELTYNLHILLRFELELALLDGKLSVEDIPSAWNKKMEENLGITPENDAEGALQDVHWSMGLFGYFPTYSMGNVLSVQFHEAAVTAHPEIPEEIAKGQFGTLRNWLTQNIYSHGSRFDPDEIVERATGRGLDPAPYLGYLENKFGDLYL